MKRTLCYLAIISALAACAPAEPTATDAPAAAPMAAQTAVLTEVQNLGTDPAGVANQ
jgi:hypothetical protein